MTAIDLPYLWIRPARNGKRIVYYRRGGLVRRIAAPDGRTLLPGDAGFLDAYEAIHRTASPASSDGRTAPAPGTLAALIAKYPASEDWRDLGRGTHGDYDRILRPLEAMFGSKAAEVPRKGVFAIRDAFARDADGNPTPSRANKSLAVLSALLSWGRDHGEVRENNALRPGRLKTGPGFAHWTEDQFWQFMDCQAVSEPLKRASALGWFTGMRISDCIAAPKTARKEGRIEVTIAKTRFTTGARVMVPEHPDLTRILDAAPVTEAVTILTRADGRPWKIDHVKHAFAKAVRAAWLPAGLSFHGLRKGITAALATEACRVQGPTL